MQPNVYYYHVEVDINRFFSMSNRKDYAHYYNNQNCLTNKHVLMKKIKIFFQDCHVCAKKPYNTTKCVVKKGLLNFTIKTVQGTGISARRK